MSHKLDARKVVFIGAGNMAEALVGGLLHSGLTTAHHITVTDVSSERLQQFERQFGVRGAITNAEAARHADVVVLAVKPQVMGTVLDELRGAVPREALVISIAAGVRTEAVERQLGEGVRVVRVMPNTPALVRSGAAALCGGRWATDKDLETAEQMLGAVGVVARVNEAMMDAVTAVSGSGPAYVFYLMEAMLGAAKDLGLEDGVARELIYATVEGAARLIRETKVDAAELRRRVTSRGGTTAAAVEVLESKGVFTAWVEAIRAAARRSKELSGSN